MSELGAKIETEIGDAISGVLARHETSMVTKWVAIVEAMDGDGERSLWTFTSDGAKAWDINGLIQTGLQMQQARLVKDYLEDD